MATQQRAQSWQRGIVFAGRKFLIPSFSLARSLSLSFVWCVVDVSYETEEEILSYVVSTMRRDATTYDKPNEKIAM